MIRLIILLLGAQALRGQRRLLMLFGWAWITVGALMLFDVLQDGRSVLALDALAVLLALEGLVAISAALVIGSSASRPVLLKGLGFLFLAFLVWDVPADDNIVATLVFGSALLLDGAVRIASSTVIQHSRWKPVALAGSGEILLSLMIFIGWPVPHRMTVPFCIGVMILLSGWALLRIARRLESFSLNQNPQLATQPQTNDANPLRVYVWTPTGSAKDARRRTSSIAISRRWTAAAIYPLAMPPWRWHRTCISATIRLTKSASLHKISAGYCTPANKTTSTDAFCPICNRKWQPGAPRTKEYSFAVTTRRHYESSGSVIVRMPLTI
nr:hypothetical protein [Serratia liquefaciens]